MDKTELEEYQEWVASTSAGRGANWAAMGVAAEAGEVLALFEKSVRRETPVDTAQVEDELGDVLWFVAEVCNSLQLSLDDVLMHNIEKINARYNKS